MFVYQRVMGMIWDHDDLPVENREFFFHLKSQPGKIGS
jgi:hypothetical protein